MREDYITSEQFPSPMIYLNPNNKLELWICMKARMQVNEGVPKIIDYWMIWQWDEVYRASVNIDGETVKPKGNLIGYL